MLKFATALAAAGLLVSSVSTSVSAQPIAPAHDAAPVVRVAVQPKSVKPQFKRQRVHLVTNEAPGTIIIDTNNKFLYLVETKDRATRYGIGVGREGFGWSGVVKIGRKAEWPGWTPPPEMRVREAAKGHILPAYQEGGEDNPLGARAMYLYKGGNDTSFRIHGTNQPWSIGLNMSSGCIRMMNKDVMDLYDRAPVGTKVIVVGPGNKQGEISFDDRGIDILRTLFGG
ncbi:lipoprotein-anchoring transpeptidase ErfK/SrfK [Rhizobium sp. BK181]|uniref:L,D-transpeptidase n=1 Tax=Rhizobium sp. BK181 TaxID=2587072 RepID=UPI0016103826|nr:L,D-transpeptidase [Rhizobium sp. BK181]MBB3314832.1 lipoprotein-anchoring transpeptidase ErfK/SrfK [Rhizobium sp. BK181]